MSSRRKDIKSETAKIYVDFALVKASTETKKRAEIICNQKSALFASENEMRPKAYTHNRKWSKITWVWRRKFTWKINKTTQNLKRSIGDYSNKSNSVKLHAKKARFAQVDVETGVLTYFRYSRNYEGSKNS